MQTDPLLPYHDGADVGIGGMFDQMVDRITAENLNSFTLEDLGDRCAKFHDGFPSLDDVGFPDRLDGDWSRNWLLGKALWVEKEPYTSCGSHRGSASRSHAEESKRCLNEAPLIFLARSPKQVRE